MMRSSALLLSVISSLLIGVHANSFHRDVVSKVAKKERQRTPLNRKLRQQNVEDKLLSKAIPIAEYNRQLRSLGVEPPVPEERKLEENNYADDYFMNDQYMYSFSGYSMKYARCQPIQQFSEDALAAGEYSPMVTQDVVILRLCPYKSCSSSRQYGCHYNYAEYAIGLYDYIRVMLKNKEQRLERTCEWCKACLGDGDERRKLEEAQDQEDNGENDNADNNENQNNANGDDYYKGDDDGGNNNNNNNANGDDYSQYNYDENDECYIYSSYCDNYYYDCAEDGNNNNNNYDDYYYNQQQGNYLDIDEYYDYLGCTELADNYGALYFVRPTCDSSTNEIAMAPYYDEYCSQSASSVANMDNFQVNFDEELFEDFYSGECMDCSESVSHTIDRL